MDTHSNHVVDGISAGAINQKKKEKKNAIYRLDDIHGFSIYM